MRNSRGKHSFIQFYPDAWDSGTAHMSRLVRSVYFEICKFQWDKVRSVSQARLELMFQDVANWPSIIEVLLEDGQLKRDEQGGIYSPRAMAEGEKAFAAWEAKSRGGSTKSSGDGKSVATKQEHSSKTGASKRKSDATKVPQKEKEKEKETEEKDSSLRDSSADADQAVAIPDELPPTLGPADVVEEWNIMAHASGLSQVVKVTEERSKRLKARIKEHGADKIIEGIRAIPTSPFLMGRNETGWKMNFDSLLVPKNCNKLVEGTYHNQGRGRGSAWLD